MRRLTAIAAALVLTGAVTLSLTALTAASAAAQPTLPSLFARQITAINRAAHAPPVLLPRSMPLDAKRMFATGGAQRSGYDLEIGAWSSTAVALDACFVAEFTATTGGKVSGKRVTVRGAARAGFRRCPAARPARRLRSTSSGTAFSSTIQANLNTKQADRAALIAAAQSAISAGPR